MAMISPKVGTRNVAAFRFSTSAHGSSSSHCSFAAAADKKKVSEDQLRGMVCYRDEKGEMICQGYKRLGTPLPEKVGLLPIIPWPKGVQITTDFIQLAMLPVFEDADVLQLNGDQKSSLL